MKIETKTHEYPLTAASVDEIALQVEGFLSSLGMERANILRVRLTVEEALLRWRDRFGESAVITFTSGKRLRRPFITMELAGERYDPLEASGSELGSWSDNLLKEVGLAPRYTYQRGVNVLQLRLRRPQRNPAINLLLSMAVGLVVGAIGGIALPQEIQDTIIRTTLDPIQSMFFRMLNAAAGPVIFLTVLVSICGVGGVAGSGKTGRKMLLHGIFVTAILATLALFLSGRVFSLHFYNAAMSDTQFSSVLDFFFQIIPNDVLSPLISCDVPQIILMAVILGNAFLVVGTQSEGIMALVDQFNTVGMVIADWVGKLSPYFVVFLLILGLWKHSLRSVLGCWKPLLLFLLLTAAVILLWMAWICWRKQVGFRRLARKLLPSFLIALRTSSVDAAFGDSVICCEKRLGISKELTSYAFPLGLIVYMPASTMAMMIFTVYAAKTYGIVCSVVWCVTAVALTVALQVASPPVLGMGLLAYAAIFSRLGIPRDGLAIALLADVLFGFVTVAANQVMLQLELILQADRMGALDRDLLQR